MPKTACNKNVSIAINKKEFECRNFEIATFFGVAFLEGVVLLVVCVERPFPAPPLGYYHTSYENVC
jgi:hypothetical protein